MSDTTGWDRGPDRVPGAEPLPPEQRRVSDRERDAVAERLRDAAAEGRLDLDELDERLGVAYRSRTYADLVPLTRDLPDSAAGGHIGHGVVPAPVTRTPSRVGGTATRRLSWALMRNSERRGLWVVPRSCTAVSVMGGFEHPRGETSAPDPHGPVVRVTGLAVMGAVSVRRPKPPRRRRLARG